jgi:hypothetical protein
MDEKVQILLGTTKNVHSVNVDNYQLLELENKPAEINEYDVRNILSETEIFDAEREANDVYRIYGRLEYMSLLNGLPLNYSGLTNFFLPQKTNCKNIFNSFKFYLLKAASSGYTKISGNSTEYVRYFEVIATPNDFELFNAGYGNNVYGEQAYQFDFNRDFNVAPYVDNFNFPATELFLYAQYIPGTNGSAQPEIMYRTSWGTNGIPVKVPFTPTTLHVGDKVYGDLIEYSKSNFLQFPSTQHANEQIYYINTTYYELYSSYVLQWKYIPFIPFRLKYFYDAVTNANTGSTSYAQQSSIPYYATSLGNGNFVWREIIQQGDIDPLTGVGVSYPFINMRRYLFSPVILDVSPNLNDPHTLQVFTEIQFGAPTVLNNRPNSDLANIGKPCL